MTLSSLRLREQIIPFEHETPGQYPYASIPRETLEILSRPEDGSETLVAEESIKWHIANSGSAELSPFAMNWNQHYQIYTIISLFQKYSSTITLSSCRIDAIARDPYLAKLINTFGSRNLTMAVEGISERICNFYQKSLTRKELQKGLEAVMAEDFRGIKLYFIYSGLENDDDVAEFEESMRMLDEIRRRAGKPKFPVRLSFTPLLSTLGTPLQYHGSQVQRSVRMGSNTLKRLQRIASTYGFNTRLSSSLAGGDYAQLAEMSDRRASPLFEYISLCGICPPNFGAVFYWEPSPIGSKEEFERTAPRNRVKVGDEYFRVRRHWRISASKLYGEINRHRIYPEWSVERILDKLRDHRGRPIDDEIMGWFRRNQRSHVSDAYVTYNMDEPEDILFRYPATGKVQYGKASQMLYLDDLTVDVIKAWMPLFTGGVTFNDVIENKDAMHVFPSQVVKYHQTRHIAADFRQYALNQQFVWDSYCHRHGALAYCTNCGACDTADEMRDITRGGEPELGKDHYQKILDNRRDIATYHKLLAEVRVGSGPYSAIRPNWFRGAVNRAVLRASEAELVEPFIYERFVHSRQHYHASDDAFKSLLSGSFLMEMCFNKQARFTDDYVEELERRARKETTKGWSIESLQLKPAEWTLRKELKWSLLEYRFDDRRVNMTDARTGYPYKRVRAAVERFGDPEVKLHWRKYTMRGRDKVDIREMDFDRDYIGGISLQLGRNEHEFVLKVLARLEGVHPLLLLSGLLGRELPSGRIRPTGHVGLYGVDTNILGFYAGPGEDAASVFDGIEGHDHGMTCRACGGLRWTNIVTGMPFGAASYERHPFVEPKFGTNDVCQKCFIESTN